MDMLSKEKISNDGVLCPTRVFGQAGIKGSNRLALLHDLTILKRSVMGQGYLL